ncbi:hypothetical protein BZA77DRAFT_310026 [Pyronema omphalodes]|nr:hypothetical protein BZA77DRAFT_310026 [Pyronema omphalodes]
MSPSYSVFKLLKICVHFPRMIPAASLSVSSCALKSLRHIRSRPSKYPPIFSDASRFLRYLPFSPIHPYISPHCFRCWYFIIPSIFLALYCPRWFWLLVFPTLSISDVLLMIGFPCLYRFYSICGSQARIRFPLTGLAPLFSYTPRDGG